MYYLVTDGGSQGNPGSSACAWGLYTNDQWIFKDSLFLGTGTNNNAEYHALLYGLLTIKHSNIDELTIISDSELMINQLTGVYACKSENLIPLYNQVKQLLKSIHIPITFEHYPRTHPLITTIDTEYNICMKLQSL